MLQRLLDEDPAPIRSTTGVGRGEGEQQELPEHLGPRGQEDGPDILQAQEYVVMEVEMGMEGAVLEDVGERRPRQGDYEECEGRKEDKEGMEDIGPGSGGPLWERGHG